MIIESAWRRPGALADHLRKLGGEENEEVVVKDNLSCAAMGDIDEDIRNFASMSIAAGKKRALIHIFVSPTEQLTSEQELMMRQLICSTYGIPDDHPMLGLMHKKVSEKRLCPHYHFALPTVLQSGVMIHDSFSKIKNELIARTLEIDFQHAHVVGAHNRAVHSHLKQHRPDIAHLVDPEARPQRTAAATLNEKQQADRHRVNIQSIDAQVLRIHVEAAGNMLAFARKLDEAGFTVAKGKQAILLIHEASGYHGSLSRVINRAAKAAELDIKVSAKTFDAAFKRAGPLKAERTQGFKRARQRAEMALVREFAKAVYEAAADGDVKKAEAEKIKLQAHLAASADQFERAASMRAIQESIFTLYSLRDAARRRRVDRAFRAAGMVRSRSYTRNAFKLAAGITLLTGAGLSAALGVGILAAGAAILHRNTAYPHAQGLASQSITDRQADLKTARTTIASLAENSKNAALKKQDSKRNASSSPAAVDETGSTPKTQFTAPKFSFNRIEKPDRALVGFFAQLIITKRRPDLVRSISAALGEQLASDIKAFLSNSTRQEQTVMTSWFRETKPLLNSAAAALHHRGASSVAEAVQRYVNSRMNAGLGV